jgi:ABC-type sugar transport system ATPase subunit
MITVTNMHVVAGSFSLRDISFELEAGAYGVLMGKTGSGKTTILEAVSGLKRIVSGSIQLLGREVSRLKPAERGVGYVPQDRALFPCMTVARHLSLALELRRWDGRAIAERVAELAELLGIPHLLERWPRGLSGGEAQRVALGRALSYSPKILLLDEPLSALDEETRDDMCRLLKKIQHETHVTTLHVTHSPAEARRLADRLFVIRDGTLHEAAPGELDNSPSGTDNQLRPGAPDGIARSRPDTRLPEAAP